jgi:hypothetical protein
MEVNMEQLNDWSFSLFTKEAVQRKSIRRLNGV